MCDKTMCDETTCDETMCYETTCDETTCDDYLHWCLPHLTRVELLAVSRRLYHHRLVRGTLYLRTLTWQTCNKKPRTYRPRDPGLPLDLILWTKIGKFTKGY